MCCSLVGGESGPQGSLQFHYCGLLIFGAASQTQVLLQVVDLTVQAVPRILVHNQVRVRIYYELGKVPRDVFYLSSLRVLVALGDPAQVPKQRVRVLPVDVAPLHEGELGTHAVAGKVNDLLIVGDFLVEELRAGKGHHLHPVLLVFFIHVH